MLLNAEPASFQNALSNHFNRGSVHRRVCSSASSESLCHSCIAEAKRGGEPLADLFHVHCSNPNRFVSRYASRNARLAVPCSREQPHALRVVLVPTLHALLDAVRIITLIVEGLHGLTLVTVQRAHNSREFGCVVMQ